MRNSYVFAFLVCCTFLACKSDVKKEGTAMKTMVTRFENGDTAIIYTTVNGMKEGLRTEYYPNKMVRKILNFENNLQHGKTLFYFDDGRLREVQYYDKGKRIGKDTVYFEEGNISGIFSYKNGEMDGEQIKYNAKGEIKIHMIYENGKMVKMIKAEKIDD